MAGEPPPPEATSGHSWDRATAGGTESDGELVALMAAHPTLLQRPIGIRNGRAVLGRPHEALLGLR